jgi:hypothetical protein
MSFLGSQLDLAERRLARSAYPTDDILPGAVIDANGLANDLDLLAEERSDQGDPREAAVYRARAAAVRAGKPDPGWS